MYRIVQEALTNAAKHGGAKRAVVEVYDDGEEVCLSIRDDGSGFDTSEHSDGFGLVGMHERVHLLEGTLNLSSAPGSGTTIAARFPIQRRSAAEALSATGQ
jgi:signal transduction histidine kinase